MRKERLSKETELHKEDVPKRSDTRSGEGRREQVGAPVRPRRLWTPEPRRPKSQRQACYFLACLLLVSFSILAACSDTAEPPPPPPNGNLGALQLTVEGLPDDVEASVEVTGPEDYSSTVTGNQTLELRPGSYSVTVQTVAF